MTPAGCSLVLQAQRGRLLRHGLGAASFVCLTCMSDLILAQLPLFDPEPVRGSGSEKWYLTVTYSDCRAHLFPVVDCGQ